MGRTFKLVGIFFAAFVFLFGGTIYAATPDGQVKYIHRDGSRALSALFMEELHKAKAAKKKVVVVFTADWCSPCRVIHEFLDESVEVQRAAKQGQFLFIDVDEWRGPAHRLIAGINPTKLPTLVRVDFKGAMVQSCFGTDLGLLSERSVGENLKRLVSGKAPEAAFYAKDAKLRSELIRKQNKANEARGAGIPPVEADVLSVGDGVWKVRLALRNHRAPRRWFVVSGSLEVPLDENPRVTRWELNRFRDHIRAQFMRFSGEPDFIVIPVAGYGSVELGNLEVKGALSGGPLEIWELSGVLIDGSARQFEKKVPHDLRVSTASNSIVLRSSGQADIKLTVRKRHRVMLEPQ